MVPPSSSASSSSSLKLSGQPMPRPPETSTFASWMSIFSLTFLITSRISTFLRESRFGTSNFSTGHSAPSIGEMRCITPGRTVAICGRWSGQRIVAMMLPPNAGRVIMQVLGLGVDLQPGAVGGQAGVHARGDARGHVAADRGRAVEDDGGLFRLDDLVHRLDVRLGHIGLKRGIVHDNHAVGAVARELFGKVGHLMAQQDRGHLVAEVGGELLALADQLIGNAGDLVVDLLREDKYAFIIMKQPFRSPLSSQNEFFFEPVDQPVGRLLRVEGHDGALALDGLGERLEDPRRANP